jgi:cytoskeletal protein RodZ
MEIIGDDKKLRALYSEARTADKRATPSFTSVWHRAQARSSKPRRAFNLSFALVTALLVLTLGSLAVWSMYSSRGNQQREAANNPSTPAEFAPGALKSPEKPNDKEEVRTIAKAPETPIAAPVRRSVKQVRKATTQPEAQTLAANTTIETWQSPTAGLLSSPTDGLFKSMPQLNENANEMKSFLPGRANDKEK